MWQKVKLVRFELPSPKGVTRRTGEGMKVALRSKDQSWRTASRERGPQPYSCKELSSASNLNELGRGLPQ